MSDHIHDGGCFGGFFKLRSRKTIPGASLEPSPEHPPEDNEENKPDYVCLNLPCDFSYGPQADWWSPDDEELPAYPRTAADGLVSPEIVKTIEDCLDKLDPELRRLSLQIHDHPELMFQEVYAHDLLTKYMGDHGFSVTKHYLGLGTAWRAEYTRGKGGRVLGINSEMDALKSLGHACGHNLIAVSGVGVAISVKAAMEKHNIPGKIVLLGTPAEEGGGGKVILLERGGYNDMDVCIMCHPCPGPLNSVSIGPTTALQSIEVEYFGHAAHAGAAPWEGTNALDAAFSAYSSISMLRQQMKPDHRVHGIVQGKNWSPNVIPDYANMRWIIRAPTHEELEPFCKRVKACFEAAALATGCRLTLKLDPPYFDLRQNSILASEFSDVVFQRYGMASSPIQTSASTDFGNVTHKIPSLHPTFAIPTTPNGGNHTVEFAKAARTKKAHSATMLVTKGLAITGFRILVDEAFFNNVKAAFIPSGAVANKP